MTNEEIIKAIVERKFPRWMDEDYSAHERARYYYAEALRDLLQAGCLEDLYRIEVGLPDYERACAKAGITP